MAVNSNINLKVFTFLLVFFYVCYLPYPAILLLACTVHYPKKLRMDILHNHVVGFMVIPLNKQCCVQKNAGYRCYGYVHEALE